MSNSRFSWRSAVLLVSPILVLLLPLLVRQWQIARPSDLGFLGGYKTQSGGDNGCLASLSFFLHRQPLPNIFRLAYWTSEYDGKYTTQVRQGKRPYREWTYRLEYNRQEKTLTERRFDAMTVINTSGERKLLKVWVWHNVSEEAIHQAAAPILKLKTIPQIEAYPGGGLGALKKYGGTFEEPKIEAMP